MADPQQQAEALAEPARINGAAAEATLSGGELAWRPAGGEGQERRLELESEVLGCRVEGRKLRVATFSPRGGGDGERPSALACKGGGGGGGDGSRRRGEVVLVMEGEDAAARWGDAIRDRLASLGRPKRLFIIVNPYGGKRSGRGIFQNEVLPLIEAAGILYTMQETKHRFHAQEIAHSLDLRKYDGIVCVSGDGVLVEFADGYLDAAIIKECPRLDVLGLMFQMEDGAYVNSPYVEYFKVKAIRIEPGLRVGSSTKGGIIDSDGEVIARGDGSRCGGGGEAEHLMAYGPPIQLTVDQGLATIFSPRSR
ncbi:Sphingosine kinase 1 [Dichanthelium oligosanthes]|uniref:Sphingosine kinase 1 n=1 Tax=Dichanthelium oligosanthes TaxID=888268 RepID=A0A1E5VPU0_9POAL|nr:Sphingosine kinase 1 [Dichanthelium oligosanthes]